MGLYNLSQKCLTTIVELLKASRTHYHRVEYWCKVAACLEIKIYVDMDGR